MHGCRQYMYAQRSDRTRQHHVAAIREPSPMSSDPAIVEDPPDTVAIQKTVGDEVGHRVLIEDYVYNSATDRLTVMVAGFGSAGTFGGYTNPTWSNIPTQYGDIDTAQLQVSQFAQR
jgi:hypothetical protein